MDADAIAMGGCESISKVVVYKRTASTVNWNPRSEVVGCTT